MQKSTYSKNYWKSLLNIILFISLLIVLILQLQKIGFKKEEFVLFLNRFNVYSLLYLISASILSILNWETESQEWKSMVNSIIKLPIQKSRRIVLAAHAIGLLTPYRLGELAARTLLTKADDKSSLFSYTVMGSAAQWLTIFSMGIPGVIIILPPLSAWLFYIYPAFTIIGFAVYFSLDKIPFPSKLKRYQPKILPFEIKYKVLFLTILRYLIFSSQFILFIKAFGVKGSWETLFLGVSSVFLVQSLFPLPAWADLGVRGNASVFVFTKLFINPGIPMENIVSRTMANYILHGNSGSYHHTSSAICLVILHLPCFYHHRFYLS